MANESYTPLLTVRNN